MAPVLVHERLRRNGRGQALAHAEVAQAQASATERVRGAGQQRAAAGGSGSSARLLDELSARHQELLRYVPWGGGDGRFGWCRLAGLRSHWRG